MGNQINLHLFVIINFVIGLYLNHHSIAIKRHHDQGKHLIGGLRSVPETYLVHSHHVREHGAGVVAKNHV